MNKSEQISELVTALAKAQGAMSPAKKDSKNPYFKSTYADLASVWDVCRKPLSENGLSIAQLVSQSDGVQTLETILFHSSGQWIASTLSLIPKDDSPQAIGSVITYARRYALSAIVGVAAEDDDAEAATAHTMASAPAAGRKPSPAPAPAKSPAVAQTARLGSPPSEAGPSPFVTPAPAATPATAPGSSPVTPDDMGKRTWPATMPDFGPAPWAGFQSFYKSWHIDGSEIMLKAAEMFPGREFRRIKDFTSIDEAWSVLCELATLKGLNIQEEEHEAIQKS